MRSGQFVFVLLTVLVAAPLNVATAQPAAKGTFLEPAEAGQDYALQGEYLGALASAGQAMRPYGLQVVALGEGKFDAVLYDGGLPGSGWNRHSKSKLSGTSQQGILNLSGDTIALRVSSSVAAADNDGQTTGQLRRIHRQSPTIGLLPPAGAKVLFDGRVTDELQKPKITPEGLLMAGVLTTNSVQSFRLHLEFRTPFMPAARGQARGNSGVYIQQRYEVQILDSFGLEGIENECGGLYRQRRPELNMCLPPLAWQTYDIWFTPPRFDADSNKLTNARISVMHNGVPIHVHRELTAKTGGGKAEGPEPFPINLQDHGNPVMFRNVWIVPDAGDESFIEPAFVASYSRPKSVAICYGPPRHRLRHCR